MKKERKGTALWGNDKNKSYDNFPLIYDDFRLLIISVVFLFVFRGIFQEVVHFAVNGGYSLGGVWQFLATIASGPRIDTLFLVVDCSIMASAAIFFLSFIVSAENTKNVGRSAVVLFLGTAAYVSVSDFLYKPDMDLLIFNLLVFKIAVIFLVFFLSLVALIGILTEKRSRVPEAIKIRTLKELISFCLQSKSFRLLLSLLLWLLMIEAALVKLINLLPKLELMGVYELLTYLVVSIISSVLIFIGVLFATRKVKKTLFSMVKLVIMTVVFYICYLFVLLLLLAVIHQLV